MANETLVSLHQIESSKLSYDNLYEQLEYGRFNSIKSGSAPTIYQEVIATEGQISFTLPQGKYTMGDHSLQVFVNGQLMREGSANDYVESTNTSITFNFGLAADDAVVFRVNGGTSGPLLHENQQAVAGQTIFTLTGSYETGNDSLIVFVNGAYQTLGIDYQETDAKTVTFLLGLEANDLVTFRVEGLPTITSKYTDSVKKKQYDSSNRLIREEIIGEGINVVKTYEYDTTGKPFRMVIKDAGYTITRTYTWVGEMCTEINETVKEGV